MPVHPVSDEEIHEWFKYPSIRLDKLLRIARTLANETVAEHDFRWGPRKKDICAAISRGEIGEKGRIGTLQSDLLLSDLLSDCDQNSWPPRSEWLRPVCERWSRGCQKASGSDLPELGRPARPQRDRKLMTAGRNRSLQEIADEIWRENLDRGHRLNKAAVAALILKRPDAAEVCGSARERNSKRVSQDSIVRLIREPSWLPVLRRKKEIRADQRKAM